MIFDIIIIAVAAILLITGLISGFSRQLVGIIEIALLVGALFLAGTIGQAMFFNKKNEMTGLGKSFTNMFVGVGESIPGGASEIDLTDTDAVKQAMTDGGLPSFLSGMVAPWVKNLSTKQAYVYSSLAQYIGAFLGLLLLKAIIFVVFLVLIIVGSVLLRHRIGKFKQWHPTYRRIDRLVGGAVALVIAYVGISLLLGAVTNISGSVSSQITGNGGLTAWLCNNNFIGDAIFKTSSELSVVTVNAILPF